LYSSQIYGQLLLWFVSNGKATMAVINPIIQDCCCSILILFEDKKITTISRNQNSVAHELVQMPKIVGTKNWVGTVPHQISQFVCNTLILFSSNEIICI